MSSRRNRAIPIIMITIIILLIILFILNLINKEEDLYKYNGTYSLEIENYLNDELYNITHIIVKLDNGTYTYTKTIEYQDNTEYNYKESSSYKEESNKAISTTYTFYIDNNNLCLNEEGCNKYLSKEEEIVYKNVVNDLDLDSYINTVKKITTTNDKQIYLVVDNNANYLTIIRHLIYNYDISINIINIDNITKDIKSNYVNVYQLYKYPTILILDKDKVYENTNEFTEENISIILEKQGFKSR